MHCTGVDFILLLFFMVASCCAHLKPSKWMHGVPVYNYDKAKDSNGLFAASAQKEKTEWVLVMKDRSDDVQVHSLCVDGKDACTAEGHPSEGDMPYTIVDSTETDIADLVGKHAKDLEFIEPALKVSLEPMEGGDIALEEQVRSFGSDRPHPWGPNGQPPLLDVMQTDSELGGVGAGGVGSATDRWGLDRIDARSGTDNAFTLPRGLDGTGVNVYVADSGIRLDHVDFGGRAVAQVETHTGKRVICDGSNPACAKDYYGHGTHCAGTVGGLKSGVAKGATIHAVKVLSGRAGVTSRILLGMSWIIKNHTKPAVISMSLGATGKSKAMEISIKKAWKAGLLAVVAGGNDGGEACAQTPAAVPLALTVGATSKNDSRPSYSNYGECTDIWAPGDDIVSCSHKSSTGWRTMSGTSMATPHVAGAAALLLQKFPLLGPDKITETLLSSATEGALSNIGTHSPNFLLHIEDYHVDGYQTPTKTTQAPSEDIKSGRRRSPKRRRSSRRRSPKRRRSTRRRKTRRRKR